MAFKYAHTILSTNFELEPVLEQYVKTYPEGDLLHYQIAFKGKEITHPDAIVYIIVYEHRSKEKSQPSFADFLKSYCTVNRLVASGNASGHVFPNILDDIKRVENMK